MLNRLLQALNQPFHMLRFAYFHAITALGKLFGSRDHIRRVWPGDQTLEGAAKVAVFVHFDRKGAVHAYVVEHLKALNEAGFKIVFVSNGPELTERERARVAPYAVEIVLRRNRGYDFGSYRDAIMRLGDLGRFETLVLCNDSVYGPFQPLSDVLAKCDPAIADVWGMTDSWEGRYHLQSYFLLFHKAALVHPRFKKRWRDFVHIDNKDWVVRKHEMALTGEMIDAGLRCRSLWRYADLVDSFVKELERDPDWRSAPNLSDHHRRLLEQMLTFAQASVPMNINHFFWDKLLLDGYPFIKRDLVVGNPMRLPYTFRWRWMIRRVSDYDVELIVGHLETTMRNRSI